MSKYSNEFRGKLRHYPILGKIKLGHAHLEGANLREADLHGIDLEEATDVSDAILVKANLSGVKLVHADLSRANLVGANLSSADLRDATLHKADVSRADLFHAILGGAFLAEVVGAHHAYDLETVRFNPDPNTFILRDDARYFEACHRPWPERWFDWDRLKVAGRLPLLGVSYTVLILMPFLFYGLALYNEWCTIDIDMESRLPFQVCCSCRGEAGGLDLLPFFWHGRWLRP